ncbi:hypothetical protein G9A89_005401 [Geosiphon pyriformis]|nr:hypothetical protein G9A89_005401 [Geosiphon pyriformis]
MPEKEIDRLQVQHHMFREIFGGNFHAPVDYKMRSGAMVLDIGCGPGTWLCELAGEYKATQFYGVEFQNIFPSQKPRNLQFILTDILTGIPFRIQFDYIHVRFFLLWFTSQNWETLILQKLPKLLASGGWIEILEPDIQIKNPGPTTQRVISALLTRLRSHQIDIDIVNTFKSLLESTGEYRLVEDKVAMIPMRKSAGTLGKIADYTTQNTLLAIQAQAEHLMPALEVKQAEFDNMVAEMGREVNYYDSHIRMVRILAQKN